CCGCARRRNKETRKHVPSWPSCWTRGSTVQNTSLKRPSDLAKCTKRVMASQKTVSKWLVGTNEPLNEVIKLPKTDSIGFRPRCERRSHPNPIRFTTQGTRCVPLLPMLPSGIG